MSDFFKRRIAATACAVATLVVALCAVTYALAPTRADDQAAMISEWERRPMVYICEPRPGEQIILGRTEPTGPNALPDAEPRQFIFRMQGCETFFTPRPEEPDTHE
jgi:hypothetical protein